MQFCNFNANPRGGAGRSVQSSRFKVLGQAKRRPKAVRLHRQARRPRVIMVAQVVFDAIKIRILKAIHNQTGRIRYRQKTSQPQLSDADEMCVSRGDDRHLGRTIPKLGLSRRKSFSCFGATSLTARYNVYKLH